MDFAETIAKLLAEGGPWGVLALAIAALVFERQENKSLQKSILEMATAQTEAVVKHEAAIVTIKELLSAFISRGR